MTIKKLYQIRPKDVVAKQAKKFTFRISDPCGGAIKGKQDRHIPAIDRLTYDNYLVSVNEIPNTPQCQFALEDGANSGTKGSGNNWTSLKIS